MIWVTAAFAGSPLAAPKNQCSVDDAFPIVGTAGFANALSALRTNAATWSASSFVERYALRRIAMDRSGADTVGVGVFDANFVLGATRVPVWQEDATYGDCPAEYLLGTRPVDLYAYNGGGAFRYGRVGAFYGASVTFGYPAELAYIRGYQTFGSLAVAPMLLAFAPLGAWQTQAGASAYAQDFVAGVIVDAEVADLRAGYTQSRGWYASANDHWLGLFGSVVLRDGFRAVGQFRGGAERVRLPDRVRDKVGAPSLFARVLPLTERGDGSDDVDLTTGHLEQEGIAGRLDLRAAASVRPVVGLHEASIALHDAAFYEVEDGLPADARQHWYLEAGFVELPPQYYYGVQGGRKLHLRAEYAWTPPVDRGAARMVVGLQFNDPEQTALYPFAVDAVAGRFQYQGAF
ncbi:MAG: hypothetical protein ABMA64_11780 [Myxococcota bacterium]